MSLAGVVILAASTGTTLLSSHFRHPLATFPALIADHCAKGGSPGVPHVVEGLPSVVVEGQQEEEGSGEEDENDDDDDEAKGAWGASSKVASTSTSALKSSEAPAIVFHLDEAQGDLALRFLCAVEGEVNPLLPISFLSTLVQVLRTYFGESPVTTEHIRENFDIVHQLLEEMLDAGTGWPLTTEVDSLREVVRPREWWRDVVERVGVGSLTNSSSTPIPLALPAIPWRRPTARYASNEFYLDLIETTKAIIGRDGKAISARVEGELRGNAKLSGVPEVSLVLADPSLLSEPALHPCVRHRPWTKDRQLSFVPPDGIFTLATYHRPLVRPLLPLSIKAERTSSTFSIELTGGPATEISVRLHLGPGATSFDGSGTGSHHFAPRSGELEWTVPSLRPGDRPAKLEARFTTSDSPPRLSSAILISYTYQGTAPKVRSLTISAPYQPYKGVKGVTKAELSARW